ncbi:MAG TPA: TetR/AcrR family transcriptional regulator [Allosphingosinicella sp.]
MPDDPNSVKIGERGYHHGALRPALIAAAEAVIAERGVDGFSLRETARRAGVSPSAPAHHFGDARGLLTAIATAGFEALGDALEAASAAGDRDARIRAQGLAYVDFALDRRARFDVMWRKALLDGEDEALIAAGRRAFALLDGAVRGEGAMRDGPADPALAPSIACWATVHGFARLAMDGAFGTGSGAAERAADSLLPLVLDRLTI